jgi:superfamily II DNA or RNA helicase
MKTRKAKQLTTVGLTYAICVNITNILNSHFFSVHKECQTLNPALHRLLANVSLFGLYPDNETLGLDPSQADAFYAALTRRLVVIQGPPGTGKTYLGLKIVQTLLINKQYWVPMGKPQPTPILVICYTNHALDQFLEGKWFECTCKISVHL